MTLVMHSLEENTDAAHKTRQADSWAPFALSDTHMEDCSVCVSLL